MDPIKVTVEISRKKIAGLLCSGFEGGVGYWCRIMDYKAPKTPVAVLAAQTPEEDARDGLSAKRRIYPHCDYPLQGGAVICRVTDEGSDEDGDWKPLVLDGAAIERGLALMAQKHPKHFADFMAGNDDAITGDVFLQCCLLGSVIYG